MFIGTVTLRWSASNLNHIFDDFDSHIHDDLDVLEMEEREGGEAHVGCVHQQPMGKIAKILAGGIRGCVQGLGEWLPWCSSGFFSCKIRCKPYGQWPVCRENTHIFRSLSYHITNIAKICIWSKTHQSQTDCTPGFKKSAESSTTRPSRVHLEADRDESATRYLDSAWIGWTRMSLPIFRVNSIKLRKKIQQILYKKAPSQQVLVFQRNQRFLCKRKPMKIWNKPVTISKAFKKTLGWRITYLTLNPPFPESRIFIFDAVPGGKVANRGPIVWEQEAVSSWCWGRRQRVASS